MFPQASAMPRRLVTNMAKLLQAERPEEISQHSAKARSNEAELSADLTRHSSEAEFIEEAYRICREIVYFHVEKQSRRIMSRGKALNSQGKTWNPPQQPTPDGNLPKLCAYIAQTQAILEVEHREERLSSTQLDHDDSIGLAEKVERMRRQQSLAVIDAAEKTVRRLGTIMHKGQMSLRELVSLKNRIPTLEEDCGEDRSCTLEQAEMLDNIFEFKKLTSWTGEP